jgi:hypothetical protein
MADREFMTLDESQPRVVAPQTGDAYLAKRLVKVNPETLTSGGTDDYAITFTQILNDSGAAGGTDYYAAIKADITATDVTGWDSTYLMDLQVGSSSVFAVDFSGNVTLSGTVDGVDIATIGAASHAAVTLSGTGTYLTLVGQDIQVDPITESDISDLGTLTAMVADNLSVFAATTSAQLASVINDETGTGALVFANSPSLVTPALGIPSSGDLSNCTSLPVSTGIAGLGTGAGDWLATPSSANLATAVTGETGSGALVFGTSPTISTPTLTLKQSTTPTPTDEGDIQWDTDNDQIVVGDGAAGQKVFSADADLSISESQISDLGTTVAMVADNLSVFAATTSAQLAGVINDETGSGSLVFATSPTLVTPALGTPSSGTLTNCTGYGASDLTESQISDLGTTVAMVADNLSVFAATTSAQLAGVINDETGSGALVFATSPTLVTPALGTPSSGTLTNCTGYTGDASLVTTGALNSGSITSGFGNIDIGSSTFTTTGTSTMGVLDGDGLNVDASGLQTHTAQTGVTAYAGGGQANATAITSSYCVVSTVATAGDSVKLPSAAAGLKVTVFNEDSTDALDLFPNTSDNIDGAGVDTAVSLAAGNNVTYFAIDATNWRQI